VVGTLATAVLVALVESGLPPDRLEIEVRRARSFRPNRLHRGLAANPRHGVRAALDDFGTSFSSLAHLRTFPFDKIKIDGSFVKDAVTREDCATVVKAVVDLGQPLSVTIVAEGVETGAHLRRVAAERYYEVQGYYFGKPAPSPQDALIIAAALAEREAAA
jgi:predicted signal transduction protein with EAL and GGDEF domain